VAGLEVVAVTVELIRTPEDTCAHCGQPIHLQGRWRHLSSLLSACDNGRTNAQPPHGTQYGDSGFGTKEGQNDG
jgi:hypothetical protein